MGSTQAKAAVTAASSSINNASLASPPEDLAPAPSLKALNDRAERSAAAAADEDIIGGVRVRRVDEQGNNYLGRLADADKFGQKWSLWQKLLVWVLTARRRDSDKQTLPPPQQQRQQQQQVQVQQWLDRLVEQQEQQVPQEACSGYSTAAPSSGSSNDSSAEDSSIASLAAEAAAAACSGDLSSLLRQSFDPAAYAKRQEMARFAQPEKHGFNPREV